MPAITKDIVVDRGATYRARVSVRDENGNVNLTGYTGKLTLTGVSTTTYTDSTGLTLGNGFLDILITDEDTDGFIKGTGNWGLYITDPSGVTTKLYTGKVTAR